MGVYTLVYLKLYRYFNLFHCMCEMLLFLDEELARGSIENFFKEAVGALPEGSLKIELNNNVANYLQDYRSKV